MNGEKKGKIFDVEIKKAKRKEESDSDLTTIKIMQLMFTHNQKIE